MKPHTLALIALAATLCGCSPSESPSPVVTANSSLHRLFDAYFENELRTRPLMGTFIGDHRYDDRLPTDISPQSVSARLAFEEKMLADALRFNPEALTSDDRLSWEIFVRERRMAIASAQFPSELLPIDQLGRLPAVMAMLGSGTSAQPFANAADYDRFLKRIEGFVTWTDQAIVNMREGIKRGVVHPRVVMEAVLPQLAALIANEPRESIYYQPVLAFPDDVAANDRTRLEAQYRSAIVEQINPVYQRLHDFIRDEYLPAARNSVAWTALPNGAEWYAMLVRQYTTTELTPDAIHELGLKEVARIRAQMEQVREQVGFRGTLSEFFRSVQDDPQFYFTDPEDLLNAYLELKQDIDARLHQLFADFPKADYEVRAVEPFRAAAAAGGSYLSPSADGTRPGIFYVNTFNLKAQPKFGMETLSLHEASPGHHFQVAIQQELDTLPKFRRFNTDYVAYVEGWALYAESLGKELGLFTDPYQWYGRLSDEMLRAMRLVVDTGLHTRAWTREQAIQYMLENSSLAASDVESEVERYIAMPGQALGYKVGEIRIRELRERAESALGARFDVRAFHSQVLRDGALPLDVLAAKIDRWIETQRQQ